MMDHMKLPPETWIRIVEIVAIEHRPSIFAATLVNNFFNSVSRPIVLATIRFRIVGPRTLQRDVDTANDILNVRNGFQHVRCVDVRGYMCDRRMEAKSIVESRMENWNLKGQEEIYGPELYGGLTMSKDRANDTDEEDHRWRPLASFLTSIKSLKDLLWKVPNPFPPCLLKVLHLKHAKCRLHIFRFRFRSLKKDVTDPHELAIATSPCLHMVGIRHTWRMSDGTDDFNEEACWQMVSSLAPNLRSVTMMKCRSAASVALMTREGLPRQTWRGFNPPQKSTGRGQLTSLTLKGFSNPASLMSWLTVTNFSCLRSLKIMWPLKTEDLIVMRRIDLPKLEEFSLYLLHTDDFDEALTLDSSALELLTSLRPLRILHFAGSVTPHVFGAALAKHGPTLFELRTSSDFSIYEPGEPPGRVFSSADQLEAIVETCLVLKNLTIPMQRQQSNSKEAKIYQAIGRIRTLQNVFLMLDCSVSPTSEPSNSTDPDGYDQQMFRIEMQGGLPPLKNGHIRDLYINTAVDETLARSIYDCISSSHPNSRSHLRSLRLTCLDQRSSLDRRHGSEVGMIVAHLSRSYLLEPSPRDDSSDVVVTELARTARELRDNEQRDNEQRDNEQQRYYREIFQLISPEELPAFKVFRRIWPASKEGDKDWRDGWRSFPLQLS